MFLILTKCILINKYVFELCNKNRGELTEGMILRSQMLYLVLCGDNQLILQLYIQTIKRCHYKFDTVLYIFPSFILLIIKPFKLTTTYMYQLSINCRLQSLWPNNYKTTENTSRRWLVSLVGTKPRYWYPVRYIY